LTQDSVMQPIILLGIIAAGAAALGTGFLAPQIDMIWVQTIGVGDADLFTPVNHVAVDLDVNAVENLGLNGIQDINGCIPNTTGPNACDDTFDNKFVECSWHIGVNDLAINTMGTTNPADDMQETDIQEVICKLTGMDAQGNPNHLAVAECNKNYPSNIDDNPTTPELESDYPFSGHEFCTLTAADEAFPGALLIDNVGDVRIVVRGANPTIFED